jgi:hypothetical protein
MVKKPQRKLNRELGYSKAKSKKKKKVLIENSDKEDAFNNAVGNSALIASDNIENSSSDNQQKYSSEFNAASKIKTVSSETVPAESENCEKTIDEPTIIQSFLVKSPKTKNSSRIGSNYQADVEPISTSRLGKPLLSNSNITKDY